MTAASKPRIAIPVPTSLDLPYNQRAWRQYADAVAEAGAEPVEIALNTDRRALTAAVRGCDGVCLPGSPADLDPVRFGAERDPATAAADFAREETDFFLLDWAAAQALPVLGICYGLQSLNVWSGGSLEQDLHVLPVNHAAGSSVAVAHSVLVSVASDFAALLEQGEAPLAEGFLRLPVNTSHHQAVAAPGDGLRIVARCPDDGVIEALELDENTQAVAPRPSWMLGVQWHPERSAGISAASRALFRRLTLEAARAAARTGAGAT